MAFEFSENVTLTLPPISDTIHTLSEADGGNRNKILTEIAAIHAGLTANYNMYPAEALAESVGTWVDPYPKPIIINHDEYSDPLGRVMAAKMSKEKDGTPYIAIQAAIISPDAIERVMDERYITGSVGGRADSAKCSICGVDWAKESMKSNALPCRHQRGKVYEGKLAYLELGEITWREYSFVNIPADKKSQLKGVVNANGDVPPEESDEGWIRAVKVYSLDMSKESILDLNVNDPVNILTEMKKADAAFTYRNVKGTFLTTTAFELDESLEKEIEEKFKFIQKDTTIESETVENDHVVASEENTQMPKNEEVQDDILAVAENLRDEATSDDSEVSAESEEETKDELTEGEDSVDKPESDVESEDASAAEGDTSVDDEAKAEESQDEEESEEGEAKTEDEEASESNTEDQPLAGSEDSDAVSAPQEGSDEEAGEEKVQSEESDSIDARFEELQSTVEKLQEENDKLKQHLHYMLAERVVDAKIAVGILEASERADALKEHEERTASSLADALRDTQRMKVITTVEKVELDVKSNAIVEDNSTIVDTKTEEYVENISPVEKLELTLTDTLMGRRPL